MLYKIGQQIQNVNFCLLYYVCVLENINCIVLVFVELAFNGETIISTKSEYNMFKKSSFSYKVLLTAKYVVHTFWSVSGSASVFKPSVKLSCTPSSVSSMMPLIKLLKNVSFFSLCSSNMNSRTMTASWLIREQTISALCKLAQNVFGDVPWMSNGLIIVQQKWL